MFVFEKRVISAWKKWIKNRLSSNFVWVFFDETQLNNLRIHLQCITCDKLVPPICICHTVFSSLSQFQCLVTQNFNTKMYGNNSNIIHVILDFFEVSKSTKLRLKRAKRACFIDAMNFSNLNLMWFFLTFQISQQATSDIDSNIHKCTGVFFCRSPQIIKQSNCLYWCRWLLCEYRMHLFYCKSARFDLRIRKSEIENK